MVILTVLLVTCILSCIVSTIQADFIRSRIPNTVDKCSARRDFSNYRTKDKTISKSVYYDYVIVGGGTAGAIVATRLAQDPSNKVHFGVDLFSSKPLPLVIPLNLNHGVFSICRFYYSKAVEIFRMTPSRPS